MLRYVTGGSGLFHADGTFKNQMCFLLWSEAHFSGIRGGREPKYLWNEIAAPLSPSRTPSPSWILQRLFISGISAPLGSLGIPNSIFTTRPFAVCSRWKCAIRDGGGPRRIDEEGADNWNFTTNAEGEYLCRDPICVRHKEGREVSVAAFYGSRKKKMKKGTKGFFFPTDITPFIFSWTESSFLFFVLPAVWSDLASLSRLHLTPVSIKKMHICMCNLDLNKLYAHF